MRNDIMKEVDVAKWNLPWDKKSFDSSAFWYIKENVPALGYFLEEGTIREVVVRDCVIHQIYCDTHHNGFNKDAMKVIMFCYSLEDEDKRF